MEPMRHLSQRLQEHPQPLPEGSDEKQVNIVLSEGEASGATGAVGSNKESKKQNRNQSANAASHQQQKSTPVKVQPFGSIRKGPSVSALVSEQRRQLQKTHQLGKRRNHSLAKVPTSRFTDKAMLEEMENI